MLAKLIFDDCFYTCFVLTDIKAKSPYPVIFRANLSCSIVKMIVGYIATVNGLFVKDLTSLKFGNTFLPQPVVDHCML